MVYGAMVKLQKRFAYKYSGKTGETIHYKHILTIPEDILRELGWKEGNEIIYERKADELVLRVKRNE